MMKPICRHPLADRFARLLLLTIAGSAALTAGCAAIKPQPPGPKPYLQASAEDMQWFRQARFGLFIHWGPVSIKGTEIGWSRGGERRGRSGTGSIPAEEYDNLYKQFNPTEFNADEWVALAQAAGMKYLVFTSKHHDGFCMFDTRLSDYKITNSPFKRDICAELADACHRTGLKLGWYYSQPDWHHPDYRTKKHKRYLAYMHGQVRELLTNYGKVDVMWFDGLGGTAEDWDAENLFKMIRQLQPGIIINNRAGLPADYDTPEQHIGSTTDGRPWETCMTIGDQWAYKPDDYIKSVEECLHVLVKTAGGGGNLLFNVGPRPDGRIEPEQAERLRQMGRWLDKNGPAIYGTAAGPFQRDAWGVSTCQANRAYVHVLGFDGNRVTLPPLKPRIRSATLIDGQPVRFNQAPDRITLVVPRQYRDPIDTIVVLETDGPVEGLDLKPLPSGSLAKGHKGPKPGKTGADEGNAFDDDYSTYWTANVDKSPARLDRKSVV
jgi:alpha-L-fucosidase